jgi:hypothetical protein
MEKPKLAVRIREANRNHHVYLNNGTYWVHFTLHLPDYTKRRVRQSLRTKCSDTARFERDRLFARLRAEAAVTQLAA